MRATQPFITGRRWRRVAAGVVAGTLLFAACGGEDDSGSGAESGDQLPEASQDATSDDTEGADGAAPAAAPGEGQIDLFGPDVVPAAEIESNLLPSVVLDDVQRGAKVNFRNLVPQEKPILLWMYAPH